MFKTLCLSLPLCVSVGAGAWWGARASSQSEKVEQSAEPTSLSLYRGIAAPVRAGDEATISEKTKKVSYEAYYDWDFGTVTFLTETGGIAALPAPKNWEIRTVAVEGGLVAVCFLPATGLTWILSTDENWEPIEETAELELGDYEVQMAAGAGGITALRFDRLSGRGWLFDGLSWTSIPGNLSDWPEKTEAQPEEEGEQGK